MSVPAADWVKITLKAKKKELVCFFCLIEYARSLHITENCEDRKGSFFRKGYIWKVLQNITQTGSTTKCDYLSPEFGYTSVEDHRLGSKSTEESVIL